MERAAERKGETAPSSNGTATPSFVDIVSDPLKPFFEWPDPDELTAIPPAPPLPLQLLPQEVAAVAADAAERMQAPLDFIAWPLLVSAATLIGRGCGIRPRQCDDWTERPALWVADIGGPSTLKTPGQNEGTSPLRRRQAIDAESHDSAVAAWKVVTKDKKPNEERPPRPVMARTFTSDATPEKLAMLLGGTAGGGEADDDTEAPARGLAVIRDELAGLVFDFDKYRKQQSGDKQFYLQGYSGGVYMVDRVSRPAILVPDLLFSLVGGLQPEVARELFATGPVDGLAARFTAIWPEIVPEWRNVDRLPDLAARRALERVCDRLAATDWQRELFKDEYSDTPFCRLAPEAQRIFDAWHTEAQYRFRREDDERLAARLGKYFGLAARLILICHLVEFAADRAAHAGVVEGQTVARVLELMDDYVHLMDRRVYAAFNVRPEAEGARRVAGWIVREHLADFTAREVQRHGWSGLQTAAEVGTALQWLAARRWIDEQEPEARLVGRPSAVWLVNPKVYGGRNGPVG